MKLVVDNKTNDEISIEDCQYNFLYILYVSKNQIYKAYELNYGWAFICLDGCSGSWNGLSESLKVLFKRSNPSNNYKIYQFTDVLEFANWLVEIK